MADTLTPEQRSYAMGRVRSKDTGPEMTVRRLLHGMGYRYRLHRGDLPGRPDLVFPGRRAVIFIHGCFWHVHVCRAGRNRPASNRGYWLKKLARNKQRDRENQARLHRLGWRVFVIWECETKQPDALAPRIVDFLEGDVKQT